MKALVGTLNQEKALLCDYELSDGPSFQAQIIDTLSVDITPVSTFQLQDVQPPVRVRHDDLLDLQPPALLRLWSLPHALARQLRRDAINII